MGITCLIFHFYFSLTLFIFLLCISYCFETFCHASLLKGFKFRFHILISMKLVILLSAYWNSLSEALLITVKNVINITQNTCHLLRPSVLLSTNEIHFQLSVIWFRCYIGIMLMNVTSTDLHTLTIVTTSYMQLGGWVTILKTGRNLCVLSLIRVHGSDFLVCMLNCFDFLKVQSKSSIALSEETHIIYISISRAFGVSNLN